MNSVKVAFMSLVHEGSGLPYTCNINVTEFHSFKNLENLLNSG